MAEYYCAYCDEFADLGEDGGDHYGHLEIYTSWSEVLSAVKTALATGMPGENVEEEWDIETIADKTYGYVIDGPRAAFGAIVTVDDFYKIAWQHMRDDDAA